MHLADILQKMRLNVLALSLHATTAQLYDFDVFHNGTEYWISCEKIHIIDVILKCSDKIP